jgi:L-seryl-tRNA(Ser) seleniumtransferase
MKVDRQAIVGLVVAVEEWLTTDHEDRILGYLAKAKVVQDAVEDVASVTTVVQQTNSHAGASLTITFETAAVGTSGPKIRAKLAEGSPKVLVGASEHTVHVALHTLHHGQELVLAERLLSALRG